VGSERDDRRNAPQWARCADSGRSRDRYRTAGVDRGCAKTPAFNLRVESSSRFGESESQKFWRRLYEEGNRENDSTLSWLAHVFTRPGPKAVACASQRLRALMAPQKSSRPLRGPVTGDADGLSLDLHHFLNGFTFFPRLSIDLLSIVICSCLGTFWLVGSSAAAP
jgi:hypothetical protein